MNLKISQSYQKIGQMTLEKYRRHQITSWHNRSKRYKCEGVQPLLF